MWEGRHCHGLVWKTSMRVTQSASSLVQSSFVVQGAYLVLRLWWKRSYGCSWHREYFPERIGWKQSVFSARWIRAKVVSQTISTIDDQTHGFRLQMKNTTAGLWVSLKKNTIFCSGAGVLFTPLSFIQCSLTQKMFKSVLFRMSETRFSSDTLKKIILDPWLLLSWDLFCKY